MVGKGSQQHTHFLLRCVRLSCTEILTTLSMITGPTEDKRNALAFLKGLESFEFIFSMVALSRCLMYLRDAVVRVQGVGQDIVSGVRSVMECCKELEGVRENVDHFS